jgi:Phage portal protein/DNase/tRNase domain of colicin-like bacteriocin
LLEGGLDWKTMSMSPKDLDFIEAKHGAAREIALALGVPPMLLGIPGDNTFSNYQEANRTFWRQTVLPLVQRTTAALAEWLGPAYGANLTLEPDLDDIPALSLEQDALWARLEKSTFLTDDEKRAAVGYGPKAQEQKFNPNHDPHDGRFTTGDGSGGDAQVVPIAGRPSVPKVPPKPAPPPQVPPPPAVPKTPVIRNKELAGKKHPETGIPFDKDGFPDFNGVAKNTVQLPHTGNREADFSVADRLSGYANRPDGYTWHHHQDGNTMQLVPSDIHRGTGHTGSIGIGNLPGKR